MAYSKANLKAMAIEHVSVSARSEWEIYEKMFTYTDFVIGFI
jgi:hypothetical protein